MIQALLNLINLCLLLSQNKKPLKKNAMKKTTLPLTILIVVMFLITACPYASKVPIDQPSVKINKMMLGKWIKASDQSKENPEYYVIKPLGEKKYNIIKNEYQSSDSSYKETIYISHITKIDDMRFINMQKDGTGDYYLHRIDLSQDEFTLFEITDNIDEKFNTSEDLKSFVKSYMKLSFFYNKDEKKYIKSAE